MDRNITGNCSSTPAESAATELPPVDEDFTNEKFIYILSIFNRLFSDIAPIRSEFMETVADKETEISQSVLSTQQKQLVVELSGHIHRLSDLYFERQLHGFHTNNKLAKSAIPIKVPEVDQTIKDRVLLQKRVFLLQDYLLKEIKANEELEDRVRQLEEDIVELHANGFASKSSSKRKLQTQNNKKDEDDEEGEDQQQISANKLEVEPNELSYFEIPQSQLGHSNSLQGDNQRKEKISNSKESNSTESAHSKVEVIVIEDDDAPNKRRRLSNGSVNGTVKKVGKEESVEKKGSSKKKDKKEVSGKGKGNSFDGNPMDYVGKFVRKQFAESFYFGLIANYDEEFWNIVYEDADAEDFVWYELSEFYWDEIVPRDRRERCFRHARNMGILHDSLLPESINKKAARVSTPVKSEPVPSSSSASNVENEPCPILKLDFEFQTERYYGIMDSVEEYGNSSSSTQAADQLDGEDEKGNSTSFISEEVSQPVEEN